jgi:hypothetical protein
MREKLKTFGIVLLAVLALTLSMPMAQITVPNVFTTSVPVSQLNSNFSTIGSGALNRAGGTITGDISVNSGVTIDNVDISDRLGTTGALDVSSLNLRSTSASALNVAGGINAGSGDVGIVDITGKIPAISGTYFSSLSGANLTGLLASAITTTWATPSYSAGDYTTNGAGGWTVDSGDVVAYRYMEIGKLMTWNIVLTTTTVTAATGTQLKIKIPNSKAAAGLFSGAFNGLNNGVTFNGVWQTGAADTNIYLYVDTSLATAWTAAANNTQIRLSTQFETQ